MLARTLFHLSLVALVAWAIAAQDSRPWIPDSETAIEAALGESGWSSVSNEAAPGTTLSRMRVFSSPECEGELFVGKVASTGDLHHFLTLQTGPGGKVLYLRNGILSDRPPRGRDYIVEKLRNLSGAGSAAADNGSAVAIVRTEECRDSNTLPWPFGDAQPTQQKNAEGST